MTKEKALLKEIESLKIEKINFQSEIKLLNEEIKYLKTKDNTEGLTEIISVLEENENLKCEIQDLKKKAFSTGISRNDHEKEIEELKEAYKESFSKIQQKADLQFEKSNEHIKRLNAEAAQLQEKIQGLNNKLASNNERSKNIESALKNLLVQIPELTFDVMVTALNSDYMAGYSNIQSSIKKSLNGIRGF